MKVGDETTTSADGGDAGEEEDSTDDDLRYKGMLLSPIAGSRKRSGAPERNQALNDDQLHNLCPAIVYPSKSIPRPRICARS
jgi:hypothetical protein